MSWNNLNHGNNGCSSSYSCANMSLETFKELENDYMKKRDEIVKQFDIKQMKNGHWWCRINGKKIERVTKDSLIDKVIELTTSNTQKETLDAIAPDWLKHRRLTVSAGTYRQDVRYYNKYIKSRAIASKKINQITLADAETWTTEILEEQAMREKYFKNVRTCLLNMLHFKDCNSLDDLKVHKDNFLAELPKSRDNRIFFDEEKEAVKKLAYDDAEKTSSSLPLAIPFVFCTGIRDGEILALKWCDILDEKKIHIHAEVVEETDDAGNFKSYKLVNHAKTEAGDRIIPLNSEAKKICELVRELNQRNELKCDSDSFVFARKDNSFCTPRCFDSRLRKYCRKAKMSEIKSMHDIRRTFATNLHEKKMDIKQIQKLMGHSDESQTWNYIYSEEQDVKVELLELI